MHPAKKFRTLYTILPLRPLFLHVRHQILNKLHFHSTRVSSIRQVTENVWMILKYEMLSPQTPKFSAHSNNFSSYFFSSNFPSLLAQYDTKSLGSDPWPFRRSSHLRSHNLASSAIVLSLPYALLASSANLLI